MSYQLIYNHLTKDEITLFYLLCHESYKTGSAEARLKITDFTVELHGTNQQWTKMVMDMMNHILTVKGYEDINGIRQYYCFFQRYRYVIDTKEILFRISDDAYEVVPNICRDMTLDEMVSIANMKGKYTGRICQLLMPYKKGGYKQIDIEDMYDLLEIPKTYPIKELSRIIIKPSINQISKLEAFKGLQYRYYRFFQKTEAVIFEWDTKAAKLVQFLNNNDSATHPLMDENFNSYYDY